MKHLVKCLLITIILSNPIQAKKYRDSNTYYLGLDGEYTFFKLRNDWDSIFRDKYKGFNVYLGGKMSDCLSLELGFSGMIKETKSLTVANGASAFGVTNAANSVTQGQLKLENTHLDLNFHFPMNNTAAAVTSLGVGYIRPKLNLLTSPSTTAVATALNNVSSKTSAVARFGLGLQGSITKSMEMRGMWRYQTLSKAKVNNGPTTSGSKPFKDSHSLVLGIVWNTNL